MENITENYIVKFKNISKKKEAIFANFHVKGIKCGVYISAAISVDISVLELSLGDPLEKIVEESAKRALREFKRSEFQVDSTSYLGVAQLG